MDYNNQPDSYSRQPTSCIRYPYNDRQLPSQDPPPPPPPAHHQVVPRPPAPHRVFHYPHHVAAPNLSNHHTHANQPAQPPLIRAAPNETPFIIYPQASQGNRIPAPPPAPPPPPPPSSGAFAFPEPSLVGLSRPHNEPMNHARAVAPSQLGANVIPYAAQMQVMPKVNMHSHVSYPQPTAHAPQMGMVRPPAVKAARNAHTAHIGRFLGSMSKEQFIENAARDLDGRANRNEGKFALPVYSEPESVFFSVVKPEIPTKEYLKRLVTYTHCSPAAFVVMLIYLERVARNEARLIVTMFNMHRLLITALTLACKNLDDQCFANAHYAKVGGIPTVREMNRLELQLLKYLDRRLFVTEEDYKAKLKELTGMQDRTGGYDGNGHGTVKGGVEVGFRNSPVRIANQMFMHGGSGGNGMKMNERKGMMEDKGNMRRGKCEVMTDNGYYSEMNCGVGQCETTRTTHGRVSEAHRGGRASGVGGVGTNGMYGGMQVQRGVVRRRGGGGGGTEGMDVCRKAM
ncbi:Cyclin-U4-1 [Gracilariopsis chorda]|uniref:Cyclin-U4-1 n=1 Tax=Gracilariopsis chorda TaxID=448386 RepID=A0A2V3J5L2_9FLOR|nr:Cyclin-U4-1 [Gracilariopsis chorda]|eukprot:PXF49695.1 Cyclin-U4-1 [Gracilariopsis chorda]